MLEINFFSDTVLSLYYWCRWQTAACVPTLRHCSSVYFHYSLVTALHSRLMSCFRGSLMLSRYCLNLYCHCLYSCNTCYDMICLEWYSRDHVQRRKLTLGCLIVRSEAVDAFRCLCLPRIQPVVTFDKHWRGGSKAVLEM